MNYRIYSDRLTYIKEIIEKEQLSSPSQLAEKFECSERTIRNMINELRDEGLEIKYSRKKMKYFLNKY